MKTLIQDISDEAQAKRGWIVEVNGEVVLQVRRVRLSHPKFGELNYGLTPPGYDGWSFHELGGGGAVTLPWSVIHKQIYVGLVRQNRHNQGGEVWNAPRGFLDPGEKHFEAASRELAEETGLSAEGRIDDLMGSPMNPNSAFFETASSDEGVRFNACFVHPRELERKSDNTYAFRPGVVKPVSKAAEGIVKCSFFRWREAVRVGDMFTAAAVARLLADSENS